MMNYFFFTLLLSIMNNLYF